MLRNSNKGFTFLEMLVALNIWLALSSVFLPNVINVFIDRKNVELTYIANHLLSEEVKRLFQSNKVDVHEKIIIRENVSYRFEYDRKVDGLGTVCILWKNQQNNEEKRCGYFLQ